MQTHDLLTITVVGDTVIVLGILISICTQWYWGRRSSANGESHNDKPTITPQITYTHPDLTNPNMAGQGDSVIVEPKSPQLIQWEEEEELRKLNLGKPQ